MAEIPIKVKHRGKLYDVDVNPESAGEELKMQLYSLTGVEPKNQKVMAKKMIKDDTPLSSLNLKPGSTIMLIGSASVDMTIPEAPQVKMKFKEDMTDAELAQQEGAIPAGLQNMGNTCYANATLQALRAMPELQQALTSYKPSPPSSSAPEPSMFTPEQLAQYGLGSFSTGADLTAALRDLFRQMGETQQGFAPIMFLTALRNRYPQFAERSKSGHGYAQQDAEEVWTQLVLTLHETIKPEDGEENGEFKSWVDKYMGGKFEVMTTCNEAPEEDTTTETFHDLKCNIRGDTSHLSEGIRIALDETLEKESPTLGRTATYTRKSRISRLPRYLPVHLIRFFWRKDTKKKAKILRKVAFQHEIDVTAFCTEELKKKLIPVRDKIREVRKEEEDVERAKKRQKRKRKDMEDAAIQGDSKIRSDEPLQKRKEKANAKASGSAKDAEPASEETFKTDAEIDAEHAERILTMKKEALEAVDPELKKDTQANQTGLYELRGVVTHQGSSADSGHYTAYIKKTAQPGKAEDGMWWWFNDDKVQEVGKDKIETLAGGGETHSALILLYRAVELPVLDKS
ncbi:cysteine proteinase [Piedraia hortae CBS 480.64]|uniref:Ubiquitin carboxyl-terminal hydrolase n=1 Tax=Piedraia hortae CBS 480.64 TaxID=1314780 RepID=A0A6A7BQW9_9PEZI|nr:cysteine proteinase [Piedraia hortae CBS 480.64]